MWRKSWRSRWARKAMRQVGAAPARFSYQPAGHESMWEPASWRVAQKRGWETLHRVYNIHPVGTCHTGHRKQPGMVWSGNMVIGAYESQHVETHFCTFFFEKIEKVTEWRDKKFYRDRYRDFFSRPIPRLFFETKCFRDRYRDFFETKFFRDWYRDFCKS